MGFFVRRATFHAPVIINIKSIWPERSIGKDSLGDLAAAVLQEVAVSALHSRSMGVAPRAHLAHIAMYLQKTKTCLVISAVIPRVLPRDLGINPT